MKSLKESLLNESRMSDELKMQIEEIFAELSNEEYYDSHGQWKEEMKSIVKKMNNMFIDDVCAKLEGTKYEKEVRNCKDEIVSFCSEIAKDIL